MFEVAELGHKISKEEYREKVPALRTELLMVQEGLKRQDFPVIVLVSGVDGAGKGDTVNLLNEWLDPRHLRAYAFDEKTEEERQRPEYWRFWRALPPKGTIGLYIGSWYSQPIAERVTGKYNDAELDAYLLRINAFEKTLADDGALVIKFWLHLSRDAQKTRLKKLESDPETAWRVTKRDKEHLKYYDDFRKIAERTLRETSTSEAPWMIVEGSDPRYRGVTVGQHILDRIRTHIDKRSSTEKTSKKYSEEALPVLSRNLTLLGHLDLDRSLDKKTYRKELEHYQGKLGKLARHALNERVSSIVLLEGWDAAGKGGIIRRLIPTLDARNYRIIPIAAPTDEELAHHYLWRFWRHIPRAGKITVYDRSWYGRVLVERVENLADTDTWMRAYAEINDFEEQLIDHGTVLLKFWLHIDSDEQLRRFKEREKITYKHFKITDEDYRNREKWCDYEQAVNDMVERTSTEFAPWHLLEANDKRYARIKALRLFCRKLEKALDEKDR